MILSLGFGKTPSPGGGPRRDISISILGGIAVLSTIVLRREDTCGGVEGGVSSSSEDEDEEVSKIREGERGTEREGLFGPGSVAGAICCDEKVPCGRGGTRRGRGIAFLCLGKGFDIDGLDVSAESCMGGVRRRQDIPDDALAWSTGVFPDETRGLAP